MGSRVFSNWASERANSASPTQLADCVVHQKAQFRQGSSEDKDVADDHQKRSSSSDVELQGPDPQSHAAGVGARQSSRRVPGRGGGYLPARTPSKFRADPRLDPRLDEFRTMGLQAGLLRIAETIGHDAFLAMWRLIDMEPAFRTDKGDLEVRLRPFRSYLRFQRNRYIETLYAQGKSLAEIRELVKLNLCEHISARHIRRLVSGD